MLLVGINVWTTCVEDIFRVARVGVVLRRTAFGCDHRREGPRGLVLVCVCVCVCVCVFVSVEGMLLSDSIIIIFFF